jgi:rod shape determining protein RodA
LIVRRFLPHIDWVLIGAILTLVAIGLAMIYSATYDPTTGRGGSLLLTQIWALVIGVVASFVVCFLVDYRVIADHAALIYGGLTVLLVYTLFFGVEGGGAQRWIDVGPFNLQPSEFGKIVVALILGVFYADSRRSERRLSDWVIGVAIAAVPFVLIAREPDLGTAVTLLPVCVAIMIFAGLRLKFLAVLAVIGVLLTPVAWTYALEDYQRSRIASFLDPEQDPRGAGYQQIQSRITVGSGGLMGKGFLRGTQSQYKFLPVAHNDFIFSVLAEEQGFIGVIFVLGLYLFVILRSLDAARVAKDRVGMFLVVGITAGFAFQVIYNVTMSAGLAPVKGLTLPLLSYGGSSIIATLMGFGLILNVRMRRFAN